MTPAHRTGGGIERNGRPHGSNVDHAFVDEWVGLERAHVAGLVHADGPEFRGVLMSDLLQINKPLPSIIAIGKQPLGSLARRTQLRLRRAAVSVSVALSQHRRQEDGGKENRRPHLDPPFYVDGLSGLLRPYGYSFENSWI